MEERNTRPIYIIGDIGGPGFGPNMAVIAFVHAVHGFGLRMRGRDTNWRNGKHHIIIQAEGGNSPREFARCHNLAF